MSGAKNVLDIRICEWKASMYNEKKRVWFYGVLSLLPELITFETEDEKATVKVTKIPYTDLSNVEKSRTGLVFGAIYLVLSNNSKVWFSSFEDRDGVHAAIKHFWKSSLIGKGGNSGIGVGKGGKTVMGQKLLGIVENSQDTLSKAAVQLHGQGQQIDHMLTNMHDIHNDLDVAENLLGDIDSWFGRWRLPDSYVYIDPVIINKSDIPEVFEYEIIITKLDTMKMNLKRIGTLRISTDGLTILNAQMKTEHHYSWGNVSFIRVITPFEIVVTQNKIGCPDLSYSLVSTNMAGVIRLLEKSVKHKLRYEMPPEKILVTNHRRTADSGRTAIQHNLPMGSQTSSTPSSTSGPSQHTFTADLDQIQIHQSEQVVSESEADEISRRLVELKALALATKDEQGAQNEKLDELIPTVDDANVRLNQLNRKANRLT